MKSKTSKTRWVGPATFLLSIIMAAVCASGQGTRGISVPFYVGNVVPLQDEFGRPLRGSPLATAAAVRPLVEIREAFFQPFYKTYVNLAPGLHGESSPYNPLVDPNLSVGMGLNAAQANSGLFCAVLRERPAAGSRLFARAFNAPTAAEATFYADSDVVAVELNSGTLVFTFGAFQPLDEADADGDGLANSWEQLLGTFDRETPDYDGDGMSDLHEMLAGTALDDPDSKLAFRVIRTEPANVVLAEGETPPPALRLKWQSVPGKTYRIEYVPMLNAIDPATGEPYAFELVEGGEVTAQPGEYEIDLLIENVPDDLATAMFRVRLVVDP